MKLQIRVVLEVEAVKYPRHLSQGEAGELGREMDHRHSGCWDQRLAFCGRGALPSMSYGTKM